MRKQALILAALLLFALPMSGCSENQAKLKHISTVNAKTAALEHAGLSSDEVTFTAAELTERNGQEYYAIDFTTKDEQYNYDIDALTGAVINAHSSGEDNNTSEPAATTEAATTSTSQEETTTSSKKEDTVIGKDKAKAIALSHANLKENQVTFVKVGIDWDDGKQVYDVEFYSKDYTEYDYDIDAYTGEVLSYDHDAEYYKPSSSESQTSSKEISEAKAKEIALAQVPGAKESDIVEFEVDYDDGRLEYEGAIYYDKMEYEFEIDGYSGAIRNWDVESIYD